MQGTVRDQGATRATYRRDQRGQAVRGPSRWLLHATDLRIGKNRTGPDLDERVG